MDSKVKTGLGGVLAVLLAGGVVAIMLGEDDPLHDPLGGTGSATGVPTNPTDPTPTQSGGTPTTGTPTGIDTTPKTLPTNGTTPVGDLPDRPVRPPTNGIPDDGSPVSVEFRCQDANGAPLSGVWIEAKRGSGAPLPGAQSDASGIARVGGLAEGDTISGVGRHAISSQGASFGPVSVGAQTIVSLKFTRSALGRILGKLMDDRGKPIPPELHGELVVVDPRQEGKAVLDALAIGLRSDGSFAANVASGTYTISARADGHTESDRTYIKVEPNADAGPLQLIVFRAGSIEGTIVLPPKFLSQMPLELDILAEVKGGSAANPYTHTRREPVTIERSPQDYILRDCEPGRYRLRLEVVEAGARRVGPWAVVQMPSGQVTTGLQLTLADVMVAVKGKVTDDQGVALEGVRVTIGKRSARSDRDGSYAVRGLDLGETFVEAKSKTHAGIFKEIDYRGAQLTVDIVLKRLGSIRGKVKSGDAGVDVIAVFKEEDGVRPFETTTTAGGNYEVSGLPPGNYYMRAGPGADVFEEAGAPSVTVQPGAAATAPDVDVE